jgi:hypothetical protein
MNNWIVISICPPKVGTPIAVRTSNEFGLGHSYGIRDFDSKIFSQEEYETHLSGTDFVEWTDIS